MTNLIVFATPSESLQLIINPLMFNVVQQDHVKYLDVYKGCNLHRRVILDDITEVWRPLFLDTEAVLMRNYFDIRIRFIAQTVYEINFLYKNYLIGQTVEIKKIIFIDDTILSGKIESKDVRTEILYLEGYKEEDNTPVIFEST